jgi:Antitoxin VbhA
LSRSGTDERERRRREKSVRNAVAITEMEGGSPSDFCREQMALFVDGKISVTEMRDRVVCNACCSADRSRGAA